MRGKRRIGTAEREAYGELPDGSAPSRARKFEERNLILRMRQIARLDLRGMAPLTIAAELSLSGVEWRAETVMDYMGLGTAMKADDAAEFRERYLQAREEVQNPELVDVDAMLKEAQVEALFVLQEIMHDPMTASKDRIACAKELRSINPNGSDVIRVVVVKMEERTVAAIERSRDWQPPESRLKKLLNEANVPEEIHDPGGEEDLPA